MSLPSAVAALKPHPYPSLSSSSPTPMAAAPSFKPLSMANARIPASLSASRPSLLHLRPSTSSLRFLHLALSPSSLFFTLSKKPSSLIPLVAQTSGWAQQEEENELRGDDVDWPASEEEGESGAEAGLSEWDGEEVDEEGALEGDAASEEEFAGSAEEESYPEPPEDAKLFVGNLPYDVDSEKLAQLFEKAGIVEVAEVIYNRESDQSRGFGFVSMSTVEEADRAVEMFNRYEVNGRPLTVNKAAPRGARVERSFEPSFRVYVGNLPWQVDDSRLEQVFSEHGKVLDARVVYDRESGRSRGFGFVKMASQNEMDDAIAALDGQNLDGRALRVNVAEERPRRGSFA